MANEGTTDEPNRIRLQVYLSRCGVASRRRCELLIQEGRVTVNGMTVTEQGMKVTPGDVVTLDGKRLALETRMFYIALHKPRGYICTNNDPEGRPLAVSLLGGIARRHHIYSVGRLDYLSSGLLLFTNDGTFAREIAHPSARVEKEYLVETDDEVSDETLQSFTKGVFREGTKYRIERYTKSGARTVTIVLREGKNRELRNLFAGRGIAVKRIHRTRIGLVKLGPLKPGEFRFLARTEVDSLMTAIHTSPRSKHRGADHAPGQSRYSGREKR